MANVTVMLFIENCSVSTQAKDKEQFSLNKGVQSIEKEKPIIPINEYTILIHEHLNTLCISHFSIVLLHHS